MFILDIENTKNVRISQIKKVKKLDNINTFAHQDDHEGGERQGETLCDWNMSSSLLDGELRNAEFHTPDHSLAANTTCNYHIKGRYNERVEIEVRIYGLE